MFQKAIGEENLERQLDKLAKNKKIILSVQQMNADLLANKRHIDPMKAYHHNKIIKSLFDKARRNAFAKIQTHPEVRKLIQEKIKRDLEARKILNQTTNRNVKETQIRNLLQN